MKTINISDHRKVFAIQQEFSSMFPNLNIEFLAKPSKMGAPASAKQVTASKKLLECRASHEEGAIEIQPGMTVGDLKEHFRDAFGLAVEIVRKPESGKKALPVNEKHSIEVENKV